MMYMSPPLCFSVPETLYMRVCTTPEGLWSRVSLKTLTSMPGRDAPSRILLKRPSTSAGLAARAQTAHASVLPRMDNAKVPTVDGTAQAIAFTPGAHKKIECDWVRDLLEVVFLCPRTNLLRCSHIWNAYVHEELDEKIRRCVPSGRGPGRHDRGK